MAVSKDEVLDTLSRVEDPTVGVGLVELGMVADVEVRRGKVRFTILLPVEDWFGPDELHRRAVTAVTEMPGVSGVEAEIGFMSEPELDRFAETLHGHTTPHPNAGAAGLGHAAGPQAAVPFMQPGSTTRVIGISSGKGGVGKSSVTVNLAVALAQAGHRVGVLDADIYGYSVPRMLGITEAPVAVASTLMVPPVAHGVSCMSMDFLVPEDRALIWRGPMLHKALEEFMTKVYWGEPDYLLFDMPPGTGDVALSMAQYLPRAEMVVVTTPQAAAQRVAKKAALMARDPKVDLEVVGIIENMSWFTGDDGKRYELFGAGGGQALADDLGVPLIGQVPLVPELREGSDVGRPIVAEEPDGDAAQAFVRIAEWFEANRPKKIYKRELKIV